MMPSSSNQGSSQTPRLKAIVTHVVNVNHEQVASPVQNSIVSPQDAFLLISPIQPAAGPEIPSVYIDSPKTPSKAAPAEIDQNTAFWEAYNKTGDVEDKEFVKTSGGDLDVLLIFAGLFSATNTAFIIESYKNLKPDPAEETNKLLRSMFNATIDASNATIDTTPFVANSRDIRINACFFASLCCSLSAAFGAVLAKQWLTQYDMDSGGALKTPSARGQERQRKYEGRDNWNLEDVIVTLPTLLQFSLFFFFVGLVDFLWPLNGIVTGLAFGFTIGTFIFYVTTIAISVFDESAPFQTRLSPLLRSPFARIWSLINRIASLVRASLKDVKRNANISCISYLLERVTKPDDLKVVAGAFVSLSEDPDANRITRSFIDFHLKPTRRPSAGQSWSIPSLYGPTRSSLLKILSILIKKWKDPANTFIQTPLYSIDLAALFRDIPGELRTAFLADPADTNSRRRIANILLTLYPDHQISSLGTPGPDPKIWKAAWLEEDVTKNLENKDDAAQSNTLTMLNLASQGLPERASTWNVVKQARKKNKRLTEIIHSTVWKEISSVRSVEVPDNRGSCRLLEWFAESDDMEGLADALEDSHGGSERRVVVTQPLISRVVETLITIHLKPALDGWWQLPGLHGENGGSLLRILHVVVVKWRYLDAELPAGTGSLPSLNAPSFISSLRAELWEVFLGAQENPGVVKMIAEICRNLPIPPSFSDDDISTTAMRKISTDISMLLQNSRDKAIVLEHCFSLLCANADSLILFANFHAIRLASGKSHAILDHLRSTMWNADLADFWRATFRVQLLPVFFIDKLHALKFAKYLHLWFQHHAKHEVEVPVGDQAPHHNAHDVLRQKRLYWTYILSLRRLLTSSEATKWSKELKEHGHQSHLVEIIDNVHCQSHCTTAPLALHLFLHLWSGEASDVTAEGVKGVLGALSSGDPPLGLISLDVRMYSEASRLDDVSYEQWSEDISEQVTQDMDQTMRWLESYLQAAIQRRLVDGSVDDTLGKYTSWCDAMDRQLGTDKYGPLSEGLRAVESSVRGAQMEVVSSL